MINEKTELSLDGLIFYQRCDKMFVVHGLTRSGRFGSSDHRQLREITHAGNPFVEKLLGKNNNMRHKIK